jgi:hypothetical protein
MFLVLAFAAWTAIAWMVFRWSALPPAARAWVERALFVAAVASFAAAPFLHGDLSQPMGPFIGGPYLYPAETVERSARAAALGVGLLFACLFALARWGSPLPWRHPVANAGALSLLVLVLRVLLEKLGLPLAVVTLFGIIWLIVPVAAYLGVEAAKTGSLRRFWGWMIGYTYGIRALIVVVMVVATHFHLGTHFDNSAVTHFTAFGREVTLEANSWAQYRTLIVVPQLVAWAGLTLLAGVVVGWPCYAIARRRAPGRAPLDAGAPQAL